jgi:hypothetical protein
VNPGEPSRNPASVRWLARHRRGEPGRGAVADAGQSFAEREAFGRYADRSAWGPRLSTGSGRRGTPGFTVGHEAGDAEPPPAPASATPGTNARCSEIRSFGDASLPTCHILCPAAGHAELRPPAGGSGASPGWPTDVRPRRAPTSLGRARCSGVAKPQHPIPSRGNRLSGMLDAGPARHLRGGGPVGLPVGQLTVTSSYLV